jgi:ATP-dependent Clp protease ATP-binding subunit ClpA
MMISFFFIDENSPIVGAGGATGSRCIQYVQTRFARGEIQ